MKKQMRAVSIGTVVAATLAVSVATVSLATSTPSGFSQSGWPRTLGTAETDQVNASAVGPSGEVFVVGHTKGVLQDGAVADSDADAYLARFDRYGRLSWVRQLASDVYDNARGVAVSGGAIFIVGETK
ncbi:MAG: hypothetical protein RL219_1801, partial [Actinomycetota bacterium]